MAFGQQSGPPASHTQIKKLQELLEGEGYASFREARGPMGFNQRQAGGKFTNDEAQEYIDQLQEAAWAAEAAAGGEAPPADPAPKPARKAASKKPAAVPAPRADSGKPLSKLEQQLRKVSAEKLAAELQRRGWVVMKP